MVIGYRKYSDRPAATAPRMQATSQTTNQTSTNGMPMIVIADNTTMHKVSIVLMISRP